MRVALAAEVTQQHPVHRLHCLIYLGAYLGQVGRHEEGLGFARDGLLVALDIGDEIASAEALLVVGALLVEPGQEAEQDENLSRAAATIRAAEDKRDARHWILFRIGVAYHECGRYPEALTYLRECLVVDENYHEIAKAETLEQFGITELAAGDTEQAQMHLRAALDIVVRHDNWFVEARSRRSLGEALAKLGRPDDARREWERALELYTRHGFAQADEVRDLLGHHQ
jgi:tetratricopeptide (TPR) repeat protein